MGVFDPATNKNGLPEWKQEEAPKAGETINAAFAQEGTMNSLRRVGEQSEFYYDRLYNWEEHIKEPEVAKRIANLPDNFEYAHALNRDHFDYIASNAEKDMEHQDTLARAGGWGVLASVGAGLVDPVDWAVTLAAAPVSILAKGSKIARFAYAGGGAAVANMATEGVIQSQVQFRDQSNIAFAGLVGFGLGGAVGSLAKLDELEMNKAYVAAWSSDIKQFNSGLNPMRSFIDDEGNTIFRRKNSEDGLSQGQTRTESDGLDVNPESDELALAGFQLPTYNTVLMRSDNAESRKFAQDVLEGTPLANKEAVRGHSAELRAGILEKNAMDKFYRGMNLELKEWAVDNGYGSTRLTLDAEPSEAFRKEVWRHLEGFTDGVSPQAARASKNFRKLMEDSAHHQNRFGVEGAEKLLKGGKENYMPRSANIGAVKSIMDTHGLEGLHKIISAGLRKGFTDADGIVDEDLLDRITKAYSLRLNSRAQRVGMQDFHGITLSEIDNLKTWFTRPEDFDAAKIAINKYLKKTAEGDGSHDWLKKQLGMDMTAEVTLKGKLFSTADIFEQDIGKLAERYTRTSSGWSSLAEKGYGSEAKIQQLITRLVADSKGEEAVRVDEIVKLLTGRTLDADPHSTFNQMGKSLRDINFARSMGQAGWFAQMAEVGNIMANAGLKTVFQHVPALKGMMKQIRTGKMDTELAQEIRDHLGTGSHFNRNPTMRSFDESGNGFDTSTRTGKALETGDRYIQGTKKLTSIAGGLAPVTAFTHNVNASATAQKIAEFANGTRKLTNAQRVRLRDAGWSDKMQERIFNQYRKHAKAGSNGKLKKMDFDKWDDDEAYDAWTLGMSRMNNRIIQENDIGTSLPFMHKELGKIMTQFRAFPIHAYSKQLIHGVAMNDMQTYMAFSYGIATASMAYMAQTYINHGSDREELKKRMTWKSIIAGTTQKHAMSSILPSTVDTVLGVAGVDPLFKYGRSTGNDASFITGNPTVKLLGTLGAAKNIPTSVLFNPDYKFSQQDTRVLRDMLPNLIGVKQGIKMMNENLNLPKSSKDGSVWDE